MIILMFEFFTSLVSNVHELLQLLFFVFLIVVVFGVLH